MSTRAYPHIIAGVVILVSVAAALAWTPLTVANDPLVRMPGTQPNQVSLEAPDRCMNCHSGYNTQVEPGFNWKGSMMAHAARDFLFWACLTVAAQDSIHALGRPNAVDLCERCHFPEGWLEGRSDPPNASAMTGADFDGVHCDVCHRQYDPFYDTTYQGTREGNNWLNYWDETNASRTPSQPAADTTYAEDTVQSQSAKLFNGNLFFANKRPFSPTYTENGSGQYFVSGGNQKRASFADANAKHQMLYSRYHKSRYFCGSCHDVSNPALANLSQINTPPNDRTTILNSEKDSAYSYFHVERTFSEFRLSAYGQQSGSPGMGPFAPAVFNTSLPGNYIARCQDCHMRDVVGVGCDKSGVPVRPTQSIEHPKSGQPLHDLTGGNAWVSWVLASAVSGSPNYDATNAALLGQGANVLTLSLTQGLGIDPVALLAGVERAKQQLLMAAAIQNLQYDSGTGAVSFRVQNHTGHKLISGFPEGRRMFVNIRAYRLGSLIYEVNPYDPTVGTLKGLDPAYSPSSPPLVPGKEAYVDALVYEMHPTSAVTGETKTFHFALATGRYKDNRIPPKGFDTANAASRLCEPVWHGESAPDYFTSAEYAGGYDDVSMNIAPGADAVEVRLCYQTTSREYIEFLRDEIKGTGRLTLPQSAYIVQTDPFFAKLKAWGDTIWQLWDHNKNVPGAAPFVMAQAAINVEPCAPPTPALLYLTPGDGQVTLNWSGVHSTDPNVIGYRVYYDQGGKAQLVAQVGLTTTYTDTGLVVGQIHCYKVTSLYAGCESAYSNILCAVPAPLVSLGQIKSLASGSWVYVDDAVVTAHTGLGWGLVFVESPLRVAGLKLLTSDALTIGRRVRFTGVVSQVDGELQVANVSVLGSVAGGALSPLGVSNRAVASDPSLLLNPVALSTTGLLIRTWGRVTGTIAGGSVFYLNDGTNFWDALGTQIGLRVQMPAGAVMPPIGTMVNVTGISRIQKHILPDWRFVNGQWYAPGTAIYVPSIWVRDSTDVQILQ